jgi:hypothetical protein
MADVKNQSADRSQNSDKDPNLAGTPDTKPVEDRRAGSMTPSCEYDQNAPFAGDFGYKK